MDPDKVWEVIDQLQMEGLKTVPCVNGDKLMERRSAQIKDHNSSKPDSGEHIESLNANNENEHADEEENLELSMNNKLETLGKSHLDTEETSEELENTNIRTMYKQSSRWG